MPTNRLVAAASAAMLGLLVLGCADSLAQDQVEPGVSPGPDASPVPMATLPAAAATSGAVTLGVTLQEVAVVPETTTIPAGSVTLEVTNAGPALAHELVVVRTDLAAADLPTREDGSFDEEGEGVEVLGEVEELPPGATESLTLDLPAGHYVFLCNVVADQDGQPFSHYAQGMRVDIEVTGSANAGASPASASPAASPANEMPGQSPEASAIP